ncbi:MAG: hypothetical protein KAW91_00905, partial [candidate division Zixibacteria bacterium]|nr:hypothetical protein [candidate division Zixibacteria bacterium]
LIAGAVVANDQFVMTITGTVRAALIISSTQPLDWSDGGDLYQGVAKSVGIAEGGTGSFTITGAEADNIQAMLLLPEYLWDNVGKQRVDVYFTSTDAGIDLTGQPDPELVAFTPADPRDLGTLTIAALQTTVNIAIGGTAMPSAGQKAGTYTASLLLTAWYEGT